MELLDAIGTIVGVVTLGLLMVLCLLMPLLLAFEWKETIPTLPLKIAVLLPNQYKYRFTRLHRYSLAAQCGGAIRLSRRLLKPDRSNVFI